MGDAISDGAAPLALVRVLSVAGSAPREAGAEMFVSESGIAGTIGGGRLEYDAIAWAREVLAGAPPREVDVALGPELGQCCGGRVRLEIRMAGPGDAAAQEQRAVYVFGAGHVGAAIARVLEGMPVELSLVDARPGYVDAPEPIPEAVVARAPAGAAYIVVTHDHGSDFLIVEEALRRGDAAYVGMIGSATKRAVLERRLREAGLDPAPLVCPIGAAGAGDKRPEIIALHTVAEVMAALAHG